MTFSHKIQTKNFTWPGMLLLYLIRAGTVKGHYVCKRHGAIDTAGFNHTERTLFLHVMEPNLSLLLSVFLKKLFQNCQ